MSSNEKEEGCLSVGFKLGLLVCGLYVFAMAFTAVEGVVDSIPWFLMIPLVLGGMIWYFNATEKGPDE